jgi:hypothetical protein
MQDTTRKVLMIHCPFVRVKRHRQPGLRTYAISLSIYVSMCVRQLRVGGSGLVVLVLWMGSAPVVRVNTG